MWNTAQDHSGVAILIKKDIEHSLITHVFDGDTLAIKVETSLGPIILGTNYSPPGRLYLPVRDIMWFSRHRLPAYLLADLNAHHLTIGHYTNDYGRVLYNTWLEDGYLRRIGPEIGTFTSKKGKITKPDIVLVNRHVYHYSFINTLNYNVSDHAPISLQLSNKAIKIPSQEHEVISKARWLTFTELIKTSTVPINLNQQEYFKIDEEIQKIEATVNNAQNIAIPKSKFKYSTKIQITPKFDRLQKVLTQIYKLITANTNNNQILRHLRRRKNVLINSLKTEALYIQAKNWNELLTDLAKDRTLNPKNFWNKVKPIIYKTPTGQIKVTDNGDRTGNILKKPEEIEEKFREEWKTHFIPPPNNKIDPISLQNTNEFHANNPELATPLQMIDITRLSPDDPLIKPFYPLEIIKIFSTFKNKAPGPDTIKKAHIDHFPKILFVNITKIFNYCLATGYYPVRCKEGVMIFIPKANKDTSKPANYRPITLLNLIGKAFGKLINKRFVIHLTNQNLLNPLQYGFRRGRGTASSLALMYEYISRKKNSYQHHKISVISRDISGAFDRVWHQKLIVLFHRLRLPPLFIKIMTSFLSNRKIRIKISNFIGPGFITEAGVPQGAPDSPDIFNISTLPFDDLIPTDNCYSPWYCDDLHQIVATACGEANKGRHKLKVTEAIKNQNKFEKTRGILTCVEKSIITPVAQHTRGHLEFIEEGENLKYPYLIKNAATKILGLNITFSSWTSRHVQIIKKKAILMKCALYNFTSLDQKAKLHLVKALIIPSLTYPCTPLNTCSPTNFWHLQTVLSSSLKWVFNIRYPVVLTAKALMEKAKLKPLNIIIYNQAKRIWDKIESGEAADLETFNYVNDIQIEKPHSWYPSSYMRAQKAEPPPIYTIKDVQSRTVRHYYYR